MKKLFFIVILISIIFLAASVIHAVGVSDSHDHLDIDDVSLSKSTHLLSFSSFLDEHSIDSFGPWDPGSPFPEVDSLQGPFGN